MKNLKITKGEWKCIVAPSSQVRILVNPENPIETSNICSLSGSGNDPEIVANAQLIADAGTTANKCGKLPSELLAERDELLEALEKSVVMLKEASSKIEGNQYGLLSLIKDNERIINKTLSK